MKRLLVICSLLPLALFAQDKSGNHHEGTINKDSKYSVAETVTRLRAEVESRGITVFNTIDHAAGAKNVGEEIRPTVLVLFGNPKLGTNLIKCDQQIALSLPIHMLVWEDAKQQVHMTYNDPAFLVKRYNLNDCAADAVAKMTSILDNITVTIGH